MNREQWQEKRRYVDNTELSVFDAEGANRTIGATTRPAESTSVVVPIRSHSSHDAITCCEWSILVPGPIGVSTAPVGAE